MSDSPNRGQWLRGHAVHLYTAFGVVFAFLAAAEIASPATNPVRVFILFAIATLVDATDGPLARRWLVKEWAPGIDGRTIDDIIDYMTFTFLPLLLIWRMGWLPEPAVLWVVPPLIASLFGFANVRAKDEAGGFFLGFPSYWNVVALYAGILNYHFGASVNALLLLALAVLTVVPIGFVYPNLAPRPWKLPVMIGAAVWLALLLAMLPVYPRVPEWLFWLSLLYPAFYTVLSLRLWRDYSSAQ